MLKRFTLENFSSFKDESSLDLTAGRTEIHPEHVVDFDNVKDKVSFISPVPGGIGPMTIAFLFQNVLNIYSY